MSLYLFKFKEVIPRNYISALPTEFKITRSCTYDILIIRMLTSNLKIEHTQNREVVLLNNNYTSFPCHVVNRKSSKPISSFLQPHKMKDYVRFSKKYYGRNIVFYHNLLQEFSFYFYYTQKLQHQAAFVNLYRILEYCSYSFPLMHASHFRNYLGSFEALRGYFTDPKISEIGFLDNFIHKLFDGTPYLGVTTDINFIHADASIANNCYDALYKMVKPNLWITADRRNHKLEIENKHLISLFKNTRNRYFHFAVGGQRNLHNTDLKDPDYFFGCINEKFLNWICFIYKTVTKESLSNALL